MGLAPGWFGGDMFKSFPPFGEEFDIEWGDDFVEPIWPDADPGLLPPFPPPAPPPPLDDEDPPPLWSSVNFLLSVLFDFFDGFSLLFSPPLLFAAEVFEALDGELPDPVESLLLLFPPPPAFLLEEESPPLLSFLLLLLLLFPAAVDAADAPVIVLLLLLPPLPVALFVVPDDPRSFSISQPTETCQH